MVAPIAVGATWRLLTVPGLGPLPYYLERWFGIEYRLGTYADQAFAALGVERVELDTLLGESDLQLRGLELRAAELAG